MKKLFLATLVIVLVFAMVIGGCTEEEPVSTTTPTATTTPTQTPTVTATPTETPTETPSTWQWPDSLLVKTQGSASTGYQQAVAWGAYLEKTTGMKVRLGPEELATLRSKSVQSGEYIMTTGASSDFTMELEGIDTFATRDGGPWQQRTFWLTSISSFSIMVRADSPLESIDDITEDTRWACFAGAGPRSDVIAAAAFAGIEEEDVDIILFADPPAACRAVMEGKADAVCWLPAHPIAYEMEGTPPGIRWIGYDAGSDPEAVDRYLEVRPTCFFGTLPDDELPESARGGITFVMTPSFLVTNEDADIDLIYNLAKWFDENYDGYKDLHDELPQMEIDRFRAYLDSMMLPVHEGTIKYLKEQGMWTADDDAKQEYLIDLISQYMDAYEAAIADADANGIDIDPENEDWIELWGTYKADLPRFKALSEVP